MSITYYGIEWDYNNLANIGYSSATLDEPYATWLYEKSRAVGNESDSFEVGYNSKESSVDRIDFENLSVIDANINSPVNSFKESIFIDLSDSHSGRVISDGEEDVFTLSSEWDRELRRDNSERLSIEDNYDKLVKLSFNDNLSLFDSYSEGVISDGKEGIVTLFSDGKGVFNRINREKLLKFTDSNKIKTNSLLVENLGVSDSYAEGVISRKKEILNLNIRDDSNVVHITNPYKESPFYIIDEGRFVATDEYGEQTIGEQIELGGSISLFDFEISSTPLTQSNFETWVADNSPINYNELRPFIPGEYEYKDAYAGFKLSIPPTEGRFGVYGSTVYIDVEDTVEKGFAEATSGGLTRVEFSKRFYTSPHIISSLVYTTENCYIEIPTVTKEYFEFGLKSITSGLYLNGEISWLADGY